MARDFGPVDHEPRDQIHNAPQIFVMSISAAIRTSVHLFADFGVVSIRRTQASDPGSIPGMSTRLNANVSARNFLSSNMDG